MVNSLWIRLWITPESISLMGGYMASLMGALMEVHKIDRVIDRIRIIDIYIDYIYR